MDKMELNVHNMLFALCKGLLFKSGSTTTKSWLEESAYIGNDKCFMHDHCWNGT